MSHTNLLKQRLDVLMGLKHLPQEPLTVSLRTVTLATHVEKRYIIASNHIRHSITVVSNGSESP